MYSFDDPVPPPADDDRIFKRVLLGVALLGVLAATYEAASILWVPGKSAPALTAATLEDRVVADRLRAHVTALAGTRDMRGHPERLERAFGHVEVSLRGAGLTPTSQRVGNDRESSRNVLATLGPAGKPVIVLGAHVDAEATSCTPGANDNASGTAVLLELARNLAGGQAGDLLANRQVRLAFYTNEEPPYFGGDGTRWTETSCGTTLPEGGTAPVPMGSAVHAASLANERIPVSYMLSIETVGIYTDTPGTQAYPGIAAWLFPDRGNFVAFVGGSNARARMWDLIGAFRPEARLPSEGMATDWLDGAERLSDHRHYADLGIPALMVTDTANLRGIAPGIGGPSLVAFMAHDQSVYHTPEDTPDKLNYDAMAQLVDGLTRMIADPDAW